MKKFKLLFLTFLLTLIIPVYAQAGVIPHKIYAGPVENAEQLNIEEAKVLKFKTVDKYKLTDDISLENGSVLTVQVKEYVTPKRGKINGYLKISVDSYTIPSEDNKEVDVKDKNITGTLKQKVETDKMAMAEQAGVAATGYALDASGLSYMYYAAKGLIIPNEGQSRLESAGTNLYNSTGLQYIEKGQDLVIKEDTVVEISVKQH